MKYKKINQHRRIRREVWEVFSVDEHRPAETKIFVQCVIKKAQALFERYNTLYAELGVAHTASIRQFKILSEKTEKIYVALLRFRESCKHEIARLNTKVKGELNTLLQKIEILAISAWKEWINLTSHSYRNKVFIDPEFN